MSDNDLKTAEILVNVLNVTEPEISIPVVCDFLVNVSANTPEPSFLKLSKEEAEYWVSNTTPIEQEIYLVALLDKVKNTIFGKIQRKRIFCKFWNSFTKEDQNNFIKKHVPGHSEQKPTNAGKKWSVKDLERLNQLVQKNMDIPAISKMLDRTEASILMKLYSEGLINVTLKEKNHV